MSLFCIDIEILDDGDDFEEDLGKIRLNSFIKKLSGFESLTVFSKTSTAFENLNLNFKNWVFNFQFKIMNLF